MHSDHAPGRKRLTLLLRGAVSAAQKEWLEFQPLHHCMGTAPLKAFTYVADKLDSWALR